MVQKKAENTEQINEAAHVKKFVPLHKEIMRINEALLVRTATTARELYGIGGDNAASAFEHVASRFVHFWRAWPHQHLLWADLFRMPLFASHKEQKRAGKPSQKHNQFAGVVSIADKI